MAIIIPKWKKDGDTAQRKHSRFSPTSPGFKSECSQNITGGVSKVKRCQTEKGIKLKNGILYPQSQGLEWILHRKEASSSHTDSNLGLLNPKSIALPL